MRSVRQKFIIYLGWIVRIFGDLGDKIVYRQKYTKLAVLFPGQFFQIAI